VFEGVPGGPIRCGEGAAPPGALEGGRVIDPVAVGRALKQIVARCEITTTRALVAASDSIASFRLLTFPKGTNDADINESVTTELNLASDRMAMRHLDVSGDRDERTVFAVVWDRGYVQAIAAAVKHAGLEPAVVDLKSLCVARAIPVSSYILLDLSVDPCEAVLVDRHIPLIHHTFRVESGGDLALSIAHGLKPVLDFGKRSGAQGLGPESPILLRLDQVLPSPLSGRLDHLTGHPVEPLPQPPRIDPSVRFSTFLACIGLVMRRRA
jgi:hypothetical protein